MLSKFFELDLSSSFIFVSMFCLTTETKMLSFSLLSVKLSEFLVLNKGMRLSKNFSFLDKYNLHVTFLELIHHRRMHTFTSLVHNLLFYSPRT